MSLGERLYDLRKNKKLSQEEVADKLNVTRQTVSKWETDESKPDFDKIIPICELFGIDSKELLTGEKELTIEESATKENKEIKKKKALAISSAILLYFAAIVWILISEETFNLNDGLVVGVFLLICGIATAMLIYQGITLQTIKEKKAEKKEDKKLKSIISLTATIFTLIYLVVSFLTMAWHLTWLIWILFAVVEEIIRVIYTMKKGE